MKRIDTFLEKMKIHRKELLCLALILIVYLSVSIFCLIMRGELSDDEFYSLRDTLGIFYSGKSLKWDFYLNAVTNEPAAKQLDFLLLAGWMHLVGTSPLALRAVSVFYGVLAVVSLCYVVRRVTGNLNWTFWTVLLFAVDPIFVELSVIIRGYTLLMLLNVWIFYWIYRALNTENMKQACCYGIAATLFAYAAFRIRVFELLYLSGIAIYIIIKAVRTREKKAVVLSLGMAGGALLFAILLVLKLYNYVPLFAIIVNQLKSFGSIGWNEPRYIRDLLGIFLVYPVTIVGFALCIWGLLKKDAFRDEQKDIMIYALSIVSGTMFWFLYLIDWMHDAKYLLMIHPAMILLVIAGFCFAADREREAIKGMVYGVLLCCIGVNLYGNVVRAMNYTDENFTEAYGKIAEYTRNAGMDMPFLTGGEVREYYARDIIGEHEYLPMKGQDDNGFTDHITELSKIGMQYPEGIIVEENRGRGGLSYYFQLLLQTDALEQITGDGLDESRIGSWAYHMVHPEEGKIEGDKTPIRFGYNYGGAVRTTEEEDKTVLELEINGSAPELTLLCIKVNQFCEGDGRQRYVQLVLEPNEQSLQYYRIELPNERRRDQSSIDETYYVYVNEKDPQMYRDCYTF